MISNNIRTHYVLIKEWKYNTIKKIPITKAQHELYIEEIDLKRYNDIIDITDIDTGKILFQWRASKIEWFEEIKKDPSLENKWFICWFGHRHLLSMWWECNCASEYNSLSIVFKDRLRDLWFTINYDSDITEEMQKKYKEIYK